MSSTPSPLKIRRALESVVRKKIRSAPDLFALVDYLNGSNSGPLTRDSGDFSTRTRHAAQRLEKRNRFEWAASEATNSLVIYIPNRPNVVSVAPSAAKFLVRLLRDELETSYLKKIGSLSDQGKTIDTVSLHPAYNHFI
ncbi:hypothetical protein TNCV_2851931 [Trichonephila clavipes]|nr:hypothetical protein TNCV_2851931 [Trichonephila clavipes]